MSPQKPHPVRPVQKRHRWAHEIGGGSCRDCPCQYRTFCGPLGGQHVDYYPNGIGHGSVTKTPPCAPGPSTQKDTKP